MIQDISGAGNQPGFENNTEKPALYDLTMVRSVCGGDEGFLTKMVKLFLETVPPALTDLKETVSSGQWDRVSKIAHKLKSTIDSMGIDSLKDDIRTIEANAKSQQETAGIPVLVDKVYNVVQQCIIQLKNDFSI
jgi:HPt (histidine-containing phosphotransfer) domain-containing protein